MALDEPHENDYVHSEGGMTFIVDQSLLQTVGSISIDYTTKFWGRGFRITPEKPFHAACSVA